MQTSTLPSWDQSAHLRRIFNLLVIYRWLSLIPPLIFISFDAASPKNIGVLLAAAASNLLITLFPSHLNRYLRRWPFILTLDLIFCAALLALSGGSHSPYYLYSLSPLLSAAFFFQVRGALIAATGFTALFAAALAFDNGRPDWVTVVAQVVGFYLIGGVFGYQPTLMARLSGARDDLERAHRDLEIIHQLTLSLQSAADVNEVEERVLEAITGDLGFRRAVVAFVDQNERVITAWLGKARDGQALFAGGLPHPARVPLAPEGGEIARSLLDGQVRLSAEDVRTSNDKVDMHLGAGRYHIFPMLLREHPVGVLLVDASEEDDPARFHSLQAIASQSAVALGTTLLCIDRAQRLAVQDERIRIAREIHDTVSQSLFGMTYSLDACIKLLPEQPATVKTELASLLNLTQATRDEVRQSILDIWPSELTAQRFASDLQRYVSEACRASQADFDIDIRGDFSNVPPRARRSLYRIAQEALTNVVKHAGAAHAQVCLDVFEGEAILAVRDDGRGFDPALAMAREFNRERFGLHGIRERVISLGGSSEVLSRPGAGTTLLVNVPLVIGK
ncbi:MAG TPA: GAF domain-containing sensor histidine kinase [Anaerolineales bacterium]|nr:GAF domain-containing sensor histidine kinase [Anaerolineales bacterium]